MWRYGPNKRAQTDHVVSFGVSVRNSRETTKPDFRFLQIETPVTGFSTHDFRKISGKPNVMSGCTNSGKSGVNRQTEFS